VGQVVAALLVGGATVMVETSVIVDAGTTDVKYSSRVLVRGARVSVTVIVDAGKVLDRRISS